MRTSSAIHTERRASERRRDPEITAKVSQAFCAGKRHRSRQRKRLAAVIRWPGLPHPYTFVSCDDTDLFSALICKPVWRCKESKNSEISRINSLHPLT